MTNWCSCSYRMKPNAKDLIPLVVSNTEVVSRIGHRFPDGCPSPNRVTLDIKVTSKDGKELYQETIEVRLPEGVEEAVVEATLTFRQLPGVPEAEFPIHKVTREVSLKR